MIAESYLPLLLLGVGLGAVALLLARRRAAGSTVGEPLVRLRDPGDHAEITRSAAGLLVTFGGLAVLIVLALPVIVEIGAPLCDTVSGAKPCSDGGALSPLPLLPALLVALPLVVLGLREARAL